MTLVRLKPEASQSRVMHSTTEPLRSRMAFVDLGKAFDHVPRKIIWWALRKLGVEGWIVRLVQGMYANAGSWVHVGEGFGKEFEVKVRVHQGSVLSPMLFIIVLEALSLEFWAGVHWDLYADDLVIIADSLLECVRRLLIWKKAMEKNGLWVNAGKTKVTCRVKVNTHALSVVHKKATTASIAMAANFGCIRNAAGYND